jgi:hypothetical protein
MAAAAYPYHAIEPQARCGARVEVAAVSAANPADSAYSAKSAARARRTMGARGMSGARWTVAMPANLSRLGRA